MAFSVNAYRYGCEDYARFLRIVKKNIVFLYYFADFQLKLAQ